MKNPVNLAKVIRLLTAGVSLLASGSILANDIEPTKEFYTAIKAVNPIVLDGDLSEWTGAQLLADPRFSIPKGSGDDGELVNFELHNGGDWTGPDDHTSAVRVVYDDENVYFGFVVTDEYHENSANSAWNGDSVQLMVANGARDTQIGLYNYALGGVEEDLGEIIVQHEAGPGETEAVVTRNTETMRTIYEIKLPKSALELEELTGGVQFGLGMAINDGDKDTPGQKGWGGLGAHSIVFGKSPEETALVTLADPPVERERVQTNDIEPGKEFYTAIKAAAPIVLDGDLSEWRGAQLLADPRFSIPKGSKAEGELVNFELHNGGDWTGPDDHTSAVRVVYDDENVYFGFVVTDEYHENGANSAWNGDSVQLMVANDARDTQIALYNYALGGVEGDLGEVIVQHEA
ncbi:MAG: sugar-binding protein, partial [Verrucomicrobiota bacterium]